MNVWENCVHKIIIIIWYRNQKWNRVRDIYACIPRTANFQLNFCFREICFELIESKTNSRVFSGWFFSVVSIVNAKRCSTSKHEHIHFHAIHVLTKLSSGASRLSKQIAKPFVTFTFFFRSFAGKERWEASNVLNGQEVADPTNYCEKFALKLSFARLLLSCWPYKNNTWKLCRSIIHRKRREEKWETETVDYLIHDYADHCFYLSSCTAHILLFRFKGLLLFFFFLFYIRIK